MHLDGHRHRRRRRSARGHRDQPQPHPRLPHGAGPASPAAWIDRHCVYNRIARGVRIAFNDINECGGDGYAIENYLVGNPANVKPILAEVVLDNAIVGNRIFTSCQGGVSWGENAIDVKRAGAGLLIRDNAMWGFRQTDKNSPITCHGTGTGDPGYAIVVHGQLESANGTENATHATANGPVCTGMTRCAVIQGNDISNAQAGLTVGTDGQFTLDAQGRTYGVDVRGNMVHDLRGLPQGAVQWRGLGMSLTTPDPTPVPPAQFNRVYRNAIANTPGDSFYVGSIGTQFAHSFALRNNVIAWNGLANPCAARVGTYPADHRDNHWIDALAPVSTPMSPEYAHSGIQPFRAPFAPSAQVPCGSIPADPATPDPYTGLRYDYRLAPGQLADAGGVDPAFGEPYSGHDEMCGVAFDIGPEERCGNDRRVHLREHDSHTAREDELFPGEWWLSPDIGVWEDDGVTPYVPVSADAHLRMDVPYFKKNATTSSKLLLRIRSDEPAPPSEPIQVRIWGAPFHASISFPREFTPFVDTDVIWNGQNVIDSGPGWRVYAFPWRVKGAKHPRYQNLEHFCLRAEISTRFDRKPPFMTPIERSNNLAQRNVWIQREPVSTSNFLFKVERSEALEIRTELARERRAYIHFPRNDARIWPAQRGLDEVPEGALRLDEGRSRLRPLRRRTSDIAQLVVDSRKAGPARPSEWISVRQRGGSGFRIRLNRSRFRESFEWGRPPSWRFTGAWRVAGRRCAGARLGVRAAAFLATGRCAAKLRDGRLTSRRFRVPRRRGPVGLTFFHYSRGAARRGVVRSVTATQGDRKLRVRRWRGRNHGRPGSWVAAYVDLRRFRGRRIRMRFEIQGRARWVVDDVALN